MQLLARRQTGAIRVRRPFCQRGLPFDTHLLSILSASILRMPVQIVIASALFQKGVP
jgi:hypothetical protein